jgi:putative nucleotide binding protein
MKEEYAIVLDFLPNGYPLDNRPSHKKNAIVQSMGENYFTLLELIPKENVTLTIGDRIYIGAEKRDKIHHIKCKLDVSKLTSTAKSEMEYVIAEIVTKNEKRFVDFFNKAGPLSTRMHQLELLPGLGKKHMWEIIDKREDKEFEGFDDLKEKVKLLPDPKKVVIKRIITEISGTEKYNLFT